MSTAKTTKAAAAAATPAVTGTIEDVVTVHQEAVQTVVKASAEAASQTVEHAVTKTKEHVDAAVNASAAAFKGYEDIVQFGKDNIEAFVASNSIVARGVQDLSRSVVTLVQAAFDESVAAGKTLASAKTLKEVIDLSSTLAKSNVDKLVAEGTKFGQASAKLAEEAFAPINSRFEAVVEKLTKTAA